MNPLNDWLYRALEARLGPVKVSNEGQEATVLYSPDWSRDGKLRAAVVEAGEYYRVSCPFCSDDRHRLWVNHRWAVPDPQTGDDNLHLAICFNAPCLSTRDRQR